VVGMFVTLYIIALEFGYPQQRFAIFLATCLCVVCPVESLVMVRKILLIRRKRDAQELCPGYDDNVDVPIGCLVLDIFWYHMGVIHQWIISFQ